jgi:biotin-(acetyl-CoA carboxylase) ligase
LESRYQQLKNAEAKTLLVSYNQQLFKLGETVRLKKDNAAFNCNINGVNKNGLLIVNGASKESFSFGEVEWVL